MFATVAWIADTCPATHTLLVPSAATRSLVEFDRFWAVSAQLCAALPMISPLAASVHNVFTPGIADGGPFVGIFCGGSTDSRSISGSVHTSCVLARTSADDLHSADASTLA